MAVISPREEQLFQEITSQLTRRSVTQSVIDAAMQARRPALMLIWFVSLIGAFGAAAGRTPMIACALSLAVATFAIWSDFVASPEAWSTTG